MWPRGFMGINGKKLEMIFLDPKHFSQGIGAALVKAAISKYGVNNVDVNEDNPKALRFYEHMGFEVVSRSPLDEQGQPFHILSMQLKS